jgi:hypothetical protein
MSMPPPGHETPQASSSLHLSSPEGTPLSREDANARDVSRKADVAAKYEFKSVKALRGRQSSAKAKWQSQGWELVSEDRGPLRTELNFRRVKPKMIGDYVLSALAGLKRLQPRTRSTFVVAGALLLIAGSVGLAVGTRSDGANAEPTTAQKPALTAPPAEPTTPITVEELLDEAEQSNTTKPSDRRAKTRARARAKARARARAKRRERAIAQERRRNTAQLLSGVTCAQLGQSDVLVTPGVEIDGDGDGVGCES